MYLSNYTYSPEHDLSVVTPTSFTIANSGLVAVQIDSVVEANEAAIFSTLESRTPMLSIEDSSLAPKDAIFELSFSDIMAKVAEMQAWDWDDPSFLPKVVFGEKRNSDTCSFPDLHADNAIDNHTSDLSEQTGYYDVLDLFEESNDSVTELAISSPSRDYTVVSRARTSERRRILSLHSPAPRTGRYSRLRPLVFPSIVALCHSTSGDRMFRKSL